MADMIEIALLRVSPDDQYLQMIVTCPDTYVFSGLSIIKYNVLTHAWETMIHNADVLMANANSNSIKMRIAVSALVVPSSNTTDYLNNPNVTMYKCMYKATPVPGSGSGLTEDLDMTGICSNVNFVYANLLDLVMSFTDCCISDTDYDNLDRNHMMLYAHTEAMRLGREVEAMFFYDLIWNLFTNCGPTVRQNNIINKPCNCE